MAKTLGVKVLHPGGLEATKRLGRRCGLSPGTAVLDLGCGRGSSSVFLAKRFGCRVIGVDRDPVLLAEGQSAARRAKVSDRVSFAPGDIHDLPIADGMFDGAIFQASLIFTDKGEALGQAVRAIRPGGFVGAVELAWKVDPPSRIRNRVRETLCEAAGNAESHQGWIHRLREAGLAVEHAELNDMDFGFREMLRDEGFPATLRIAAKCLFQGETRRKAHDVSVLFRDVGSYLGYGIYVARRPTADRSDPIPSGP